MKVSDNLLVEEYTKVENVKKQIKKVKEWDDD